MKSAITLMAVSLAVLSSLAGCTFSPQVLDRVGPPPPHASGLIGDGRLRVYTATERRPDGENSYVYPHTDFQIYTSDGRFSRRVENHVGFNDRAPAFVTLPAGNYDLHAKSAFGPVIVPVRIEPGRLTEVDLDAWGVKASHDTKDTSAVWLPKGDGFAHYKVGWRADLAGSPVPEK